MRRRTASVLLFSLILAAAAPAHAGGPRDLRAVAVIGRTLAGVKLRSFEWVDAGRNGHVAFEVTSRTARHLFEFRNGFEKPYGAVVKIESSESSLEGPAFSDDGVLAYRKGSLGCEVWRSLDGLPPKSIGSACGDPADGAAFYSTLPGTGAYFRGTYYFKSLYGPTASEARNRFMTLRDGSAPAPIGDECSSDAVCRNVVVDPTGQVWGATQTDIYRLGGGKPQAFIHQVPAFVDSWGLAKDQILTQFGNRLRLWDLTDGKYQIVLRGGGDLLCCAAQNGSLFGRQTKASDPFVNQLMRVQ